MLALSWCSADAHEEFERCLYLGLLASRKSYTAPEVPGDPCLDRCLGSALWVGALDRSLGSVPWIGALDRVRLGAVPGGIPGSQAGARPCAPRPPGGAAPAPPRPPLHGGSWGCAGIDERRSERIKHAINSASLPTIPIIWSFTGGHYGIAVLRAVLLSLQSPT